MPTICNGVKLGDGGREVGLACRAQCTRVGPEANKIVINGSDLIKELGAVGHALHGIHEFLLSCINDQLPPYLPFTAKCYIIFYSVLQQQQFCYCIYTIFFQRVLIINPQISFNLSQN